MDLTGGIDPESSGFHTVPLVSGDILVPDPMNVVRSTQLASELVCESFFETTADGTRSRRRSLAAPACTPL